MARVLWLALKIAIAVAVAVWVAGLSGTVTIEEFGWRLEQVHIGFLVLAMAILIGLAALAYRFWRFLYRSPRSVSRYLQDNRRGRGYKALSQGMVAVAAGDAGEARRCTKRAEGLLSDPPLTLLLSAQAAQLGGDEGAARRYFETMLESPDTRFLGLRGLVNQAIKEGDDTRALSYLEEAKALRPKTPWVLRSLVELSERSGNLDAAAGALKAAAKANAIAAPAAKEKRAQLLLTQALEKIRDGGVDLALQEAAFKKAKEARRLRPGWLPATLVVARLALQAGRYREAAKALEQAWAMGPHPDLARLYRAAAPEADALAQIKRFKKLTAGNANHPESRIALAEAALGAELWGEARRHLQPLVEGEIAADRRAQRLMARVVEAEGGTPEAIRRWLEASLEGPAEGQWLCAACGAGQPDWSSSCETCGVTASVDWRHPPAPEPLVAIPKPANDPAKPEPKKAPPPIIEATPQAV